MTEFLSIIVPVYNEAESLPELHRQIDAVSQSAQIPLEVLFVDDGSTDESWQIISSLAKQDSRVRAIRFRRNFGKAAALTAGMKQAKGEVLMMMDADLQDDPAEIPRFLAQLQSGDDVVNGWKQSRHDPWHKVYPSRVFNWMVSRMTGLKLHDHNCGLKMFRAEVASEIRIYGELHRFIAALAHARGFRVSELVVNHRPRKFGHSKYGFRRFTRGFLDLLTVSFLTFFGQRPLHMLGTCGLFSFLFGLLGMGFLAVLWVCMNVLGILPIEPIGSRPLMMYSVLAAILGGQALALGLLAELIVANTTHQKHHFSIKDTIEVDRDQTPSVKFPSSEQPRRSA